MKVFYFVTNSAEGGAQTIIQQLLQGHRQRGDRAVVMAQGRGLLAQQTEALGFEYRENKYMRKTYNPLVLLLAAGVFLKSVRRVRPAIVSIHSSFSGIIGRLSLLGRIPTVYTSHGWGFSYGKRAGWLNALAEKLAGVFTQKIICVSERDRQIALQYHIAPERKLAVVHNGTSIPPVAASLDGDTVRIAFVGRFAAPKRQDLLIDALVALPAQLRQMATITFIGGGPQKERILQQLSANGMSGSVTLVGPLSPEATKEMLTQHTVAVLLSDSEGFPMAVLEAMAAGLPVIASKVGGIPEAVDESSGILVANTAESVAAALRTLLEDRSRIRRMGAAARARAIKHFSLQQFLEKMQTVYASLARADRTEQFQRRAVTEHEEQSNV